MAHPALDEFGRILMTRVRDKAIQEWRGIIRGKYKSRRAVEIAQLVKKAGSSARELLFELTPELVDLTLHHLLWTLEQIAIDEPPTIELTVRAAGEVVRNLPTISDGFPGELYTEYGWIARFSKEPPNPL